METCTSIYGQLQHPNIVVSELDGDDFVGQSSQFLVAGLETSGSKMSYALYELTLHPEIQKRLMDEFM
jgi:cytochrome P450